MKKILTTLLLAIAVFSMAAPGINKTEKKHRKVSTTTDEKDKTTEAPKKELSPAEKKAKRERTIMENKNEVWNSSNGGGRISYH